MSTRPLRLRFAPSPSGALHLGNARTAIVNWLVARQGGGQLVLRIEDTDVERVQPEAERVILDDLAWLGVRWDEGPDVGGPHAPYRQSERLSGYTEAAQDIVGAGRAYPCFCSTAVLEAERAAQLGRREPPRYGGRCAALAPSEAAARLARGEPSALRARVGSGRLVVQDRIKGAVVFERESLGDFVLVRSDGRPTYNLAAVVDDHAMGITLVLRGEDHLPNTPFQLVLYEALGWMPPSFGHLGLLVGPDGAPLSKRHGARALDEYRAEGYLSDAIVAYLASLGGGPDPESPGPPGQGFALERLSPGPVVFDDARLRRVNRVRLAGLPPSILAVHAAAVLARHGLDPRESRVTAALELFREDADTLTDLVHRVAACLTWRPRSSETEGALAAILDAPGGREALAAVRAAVLDTETLTVENARKTLERAAGASGLRGRALLHPVRLALTWCGRGPELPRLLALLGRAEVLRRLDRVLGRVGVGLERHP